jgi:hypothetical protein
VSTQTLSVLGFVFLVAAVIAAILNLKRVANLGMIWLPAILIVLGVGFILNSRRRA